MFESIRNHRRWLMVILLLLVFPSFVFFGLEGYTRFMQADNSVAKVGRTSISEQELENAMRNRVDQLRQQFGASIDPRMIDTPETRKLMLDQLLDQRVLEAEMRKSNIVASDQLLRDTIQGFPEVQKDGKFDYETYRSLLTARGSNEQTFEARMRGELAQDRVGASVSNSVLIPKQLLDRLIIANEQTVQVQEQLFKKEGFVDQVASDDAALKKFYEENKKQFETTEKISAEYVILSSQSLASGVAVSADEIKSFYDQNQLKYASQEQRRASHILINATKDAKDADKQAARKQAEEILAQVKADPAAFARIAKEKSQDKGSGQQGGDLGFFGKDAMVKPFEDAVFGMKQGDISGIVQSDFGYHIITLTGIKPGGVRPLEEVKSEIEAELRKTKAAKLFAESAEQFSNLVYEQADTFKPVQEKFKLAVQRAEGLTRAQTSATPRPNDALSPKVIEALFKDDSVKSRKNTPAIDAASNTLVSARVIDYQPARIPPFDEIRAQVQQRFVQAEAGKRAIEAGKQRLAKLTAGSSAADTNGFSALKDVSRANPAGLSPVAIRTIKQGAAAGKFPVAVGAELEDGSYAVYRLAGLGIKPAIDDAKRNQFAQSISRVVADQESRGVLADLRLQHKAKISKTTFATADPNTPAAPRN